MTFSIIGSGNTAWFLAKKLKAAGHMCTAIHSRNKVTGTALAEAMNCLFVEKLSDIHDGADCCIIAISDHAIVNIASQLAFKQTVLVHTAGAIEMNVLERSAPDHGVLWPVYSITKMSPPEHRDIPCVCEMSSAKAGKVIAALAESFTDIVFEASGDQRRWLHLSAVLGNNFTNHLMALAEQICKTHDIPFSLLVPILKQTFERVFSTSPYEQQTGPAKRGDDITLQKHMDMLQAYPDLQQLYQLISSSIENMYRQKEAKA